MSVESIIQGDTDPIPFVLSDEDGPASLADATLVEWRMGAARPGLPLPTVIAPCLVDDDGATLALKGRGRWVPVDPQTATPGLYHVRWRVVYSGGGERTFPSGEPEELLIRAQIA